MCLRELELDDTDALLAWLRDPDISRWAEGDLSGVSREQAQSFILGALITEGDLYRVVTDDSGAFLGLAGLKHIDTDAARAEFSIGLLGRAKGRGLARRAAAALLELAWTELGLDRVYMYTRQDNQATCDFNRRCGFRLLDGPPAGLAPIAGAVWYEALPSQQPC